MRERTLCGDMESDYYHKYPFGTVHFLISLMEQEGVRVDLGDLFENKTFNIQGKQLTSCFGQVLLRADDALYSTLSPYRANALNWWEWLDPQKSYQSMQQIIKYINSCSINKSKEYKQQIGLFFKGFGCDGWDGAFSTVTDKAGKLLPKVKLFYEEMGRFIPGRHKPLPENYVIHKGSYNLDTLSRFSDASILESESLYSYAFIYGPSKSGNLSYTTNMD